MKDLIKALEIFLKYSKGDYAPLHCEHDILYVCDGIDPDSVSEEDKKELDELGFHKEEGGFVSYRYGSC